MIIHSEYLALFVEVVLSSRWTKMSITTFLLLQKPNKIDPDTVFIILKVLFFLILVSY